MLQNIFFPAQFIPHGHCYLWSPGLVWLHLASDVLTAIAYYSIPMMLIYFVRKREDIPFPGIFLLFGLFIITCGTTHIISVWTLWHPTYWLSGTIKAITALFSIYTALALIPTIPAALALPKPAVLKQINQQLETEIEERKQAEANLTQLNQELETRVKARTAALQESEKRSRSLFESAPDFIYILDQYGIIQQVNPTVIKQSGYSKIELLKHPLAMFLRSKTPTIYQQVFSTLLTTGSHRQEMEFICKDGRILTMDCSYTLVKESASDDYILVLQRDMTERKKTEEERNRLLAVVQQSERRWRSFLDDVRLMVVGLDSAGRVNYVNPHCLALMGYQQQEIENKNGLEIFLPRQKRQQRQVFFQSLLKSQTPSYHQDRVFTCSGDEKIIAWNTTVLKDPKGDSTGILSIGEDITERYAIDRMKDEFISVISHELRTPLTSIHGALDLLASGLVSPQSERGQHILSIAVESSTRLVQLVNNILELERLESEKIKLDYAIISIRELVQRAYTLTELMAKQADIQLEITETDDLIWADGERIIQVLTNLLNNAVKFSEPKSIVWVMVEQTITSHGSYVKFLVQDQGRGIPCNKLEHIFERFHQVDASDSRCKGGTGLGLAICRSIVQQHGGNIWAESTFGEGSCVSFTVPNYCQTPLS